MNPCYYIDICSSTIKYKEALNYFNVKLFIFNIDYVVYWKIYITLPKNRLRNTLLTIVVLPLCIPAPIYCNFLPHRFYFLFAKA